MLEDPGLGRFIDAQNPVFEAVCAELAGGAKRTHWMWFIFPQLRMLGRSSTARFFGIEDRVEAQAYWQHPLLSERLRRCTMLVLAVQGRTVQQIFGSPDDLKLRSCMTLFEVVAPAEAAFGEVLARYYDGVRDETTIRALGYAV